MKKWIAFVVIFFAALTVKAQYIDGPDRYFYDEEFDWRWDVRVRISDGIRSGYLTNREANRLYRKLENIERKEWAFQSDGYYSPWEQDEIWLDVVALNRSIGLELSDWDRRYYGYTGVVITGPLRWYAGHPYDFYRFDKRGYGTIRVGYAPRNYYPVKHVYYTKRNNYTTHWNKRPARVASPARSNSASREYSERTSRSAAPDRSGSVRTSTSRNSAPARSSSSTQRETSRSSAPERTSGRVETPTRSSRSSGNASSTPARPSSVERSTSSNSAAPKSSVERKSKSRSSGVSSSNRSARSEGSSSARSSSKSSGSRSRD